MPDAFTYGEADAEELATVCQRLRSGKHPKDVIVKQLKEVAAVLEARPQDAQSLGDAAQQLPAVLAQKHIMQHTDKDVKLYAAACIAQLLRIWAPELPFDDKHMQQAFTLLLWVVKRLQDHNAPTYEMAVSTLQVLNQTRGYLVLLDMEREDLVLDWMRALLDSASGAGPDLAYDTVVEMLSGMMAEEDAQEPGLELLLSYLVPDRAAEAPAAARAAKAVLQRCELSLKVRLQKFMMRLLLSPISSNSDLRDHAYALVAELYLLMPQVMVPVIPHLSSQLAAEDDTKRLEAVQLLGRLVSAQNINWLVADFGELLEELMLRFKDNKAAVRLVMLQMTPLLVEATSSSQDVSHKVLAVAAERLQDYDDKVRIAAVKAVCAVAAKSYSFVPQQLLDAVSMRLRDTKPPVRKHAMASLLEVFKAKVVRAGVHGCQPVLWILSRVLLVVKADSSLKQYLMEGLGTGAVLPAALTPADVALLWVMLYSQAPTNEKDAIERFLRAQAGLQGDLVVFLELRKASSSKDGGVVDPQALQAKLDKAQQHLARQLPDSTRNEAHMTALRSVKDNKVIAALLAAFMFGVSAEVHTQQLKDAVQRVGSKSHVAEFLHTLDAWASPCSWFPAEAAAALLEVLLSAAAGPSAGTLPGNWQHLTAAQMDNVMAACYSWTVLVGKVAAGVFAGQVHGQLALMQSSSPDLQVLGAQLLARTCLLAQRKSNQHPAAYLKKAGSGNELPKELLPRLRELAMSGPLKAAKASVLALHALLPPGRAEQDLTGLCQDLVDGLGTEGGAHAAAKLQAISSIGRIAPGVVAPHLQQLMSFVLEDYLYAVDLQEDSQAAEGPTPLSSSQRSGALTSQLSNAAGEAPTNSMLLKAAAIKALARTCVPDRGDLQIPLEMLQVLVPLMVQLEGLLEASSQPAFLDDAPELEGGCLRLAAASSLLRLARRHDSRMLPSTYVLLALMLQDPLEEVRRLFQAKLVRLVGYLQERHRQQQLPAKYAAMLPLAAMDPSSANKLAAAEHLQAFVQLRRQALARAAATAAATAAAGGDGAGGAAAGGALTQQPEMLLPYTLYILAHHPDFPNVEDEELVDALEPFQFMLQFVVQPLLRPGAGEPPAAALPLILKITRTLKRTEDAADVPCNEQLYLLCDVTAAIARHCAEALLGGVARQPDYPAMVVLPKGLFKPAAAAAKGAKDASHLPTGFTVVLDPDAVALPAPAPAPTSTGALPGAAAKPPSSPTAGGGRSKAPRPSPRSQHQQQHQQQPLISKEGVGERRQKRTSPQQPAADSPAKRTRRQHADGGSSSAQGEDGEDSDSEVMPVPKQRGSRAQQSPQPTSAGAAQAATTQGTGGSQQQFGRKRPIPQQPRSGSSPGAAKRGRPGAQQQRAVAAPSSEEQGNARKPRRQAAPGCSKQAQSPAVGTGIGQQLLRTIVADASSPCGPSSRSRSTRGAAGAPPAAAGQAEPQPAPAAAPAAEDEAAYAFPSSLQDDVQQAGGLKAGAAATGRQQRGKHSKTTGTEPSGQSGGAAKQAARGKRGGGAAEHTEKENLLAAANRRSPRSKGREQGVKGR